MGIWDEKEYAARPYVFYWFEQDAQLCEYRANDIDPVDRNHAGWICMHNGEIVDQCGDTFQLIGRLIVEGKIKS